MSDCNRHRGSDGFIQRLVGMHRVRRFCRPSWHRALWNAPQVPQMIRYCSSVPINTTIDRHEFQAETRQLLDIVTNSIYTDKEVFIRELISNASDALEKFRHVESMGETLVDPEIKPAIYITTDEAKHTLTIADTGIGMTKEELKQNLGTIARSGSKAFLEKLKTEGKESGIIGKFGVGFYSAFMVGDRIEVHTSSARNGQEHHIWRSDGTGVYEIEPTEKLDRGCKVIIHLKDSCKEYAKAKMVEAIVRKYSNFVSFPIYLNGEAVNTIQALWTMDAKSVSEDQFTEFYKYVANAFDKPMYRLQFRADAPIELNALFFIGSSHMEKHGFARLDPGVSLYSRKVLIERNSKHVLPDWMRFVKGVVDSADIPLNLSRESMQDSRLLHRIRDVLTRRFLRFLEAESTKDATKFNQFFEEFGVFLKEGLCSDFAFKHDIAKLMRYESSALDAGLFTSFDDYVGRCTPDQDKIYYLCAPTRELALSSPYYEAFKRRNIEVLFVYGTIDDFVMSNVGEFNKRQVISVEVADLKSDENPPETLLKQEQLEVLSNWLQSQLSEQVKEVKISTRLSDSPAVITSHESASIRRMMTMINEAKATPLSKHVLEINPSHKLIEALEQLRVSKPELAEKLARQLYDNAAIAAGLMDDGRSMLPRLNALLADLLP